MKNMIKGSSVVFVFCLFLSYLAVHYLEELSMQNYHNFLVLIYHDKSPTFWLAAIFFASLIYLGRRLLWWGQVAVSIFVGAGMANVTSNQLWQGVPDYLNFYSLGLDLIANIPDVLLLISAGMILTSIYIQMQRIISSETESV